MRVPAAALIGLSLLTACSGGVGRQTTAAAPAVAVQGSRSDLLVPAAPVAPPVFPLSFWERPLPSDVPLDPRSPAMAADLAGQVARIQATKGWHPNLNTVQYAPPVYRAQPGQATVRVRGTSCQGKSPARMQQWSDALGPVPIPAGARPSAGSDSQLVVWQPSTDTVWELWVSGQAPDGSWYACWGGKLTDASLSNGVFPFPYGTAGSGLSELGGLVSPDEVKAGVITHALSVALPSTAARPVSPANRTDGSGPVATQLGEGSRFRLPADYPVTGTRSQQIFVTALKEYGAVVSDRSGNVSFIGENVLAETGTNGWNAVLDVADYHLFDGIDWSQVQVVDPAFDAAVPVPTALPVPSLPSVPVLHPGADASAT